MTERIALTLREAADAVGLSERTLLRAIKAGDLVPRYPTRKAVILADELRAWIDAAPTEQKPRS